MKKILFLIGSLPGGGAEKVLCDIISNLDSNKFDVTVMTIYDRGIYINEVKKYAKYKTCFKELTKGANIYQKIKNVLITKVRHLLENIPEKYFYKLMIKEKYDLEVAFLEDKSTKIIASSTNKKSKKYAWVHIDLEINNWCSKFYKNINEQIKCYKQFDKIVCVSEDCKNGFKRKIGIDNNVYTQYNPLNEVNIISKGNHMIDDIALSTKFKIISVGRLEEQKGYDRLLIAHKMLIEEGFDHELWILGDGSKKQEYIKYITDNKLTDSVKLLGFKDNPYKYIKHCDLFVCSSRQEGFSLVVAEAMILGKAILSTTCSGPNELLGFGEYGMIVDNSTDGIYNGLKKFMVDKKLHEHYIEKSKNRGSEFNLMERIKEIENILN